jgi:hypothetical protein
MWDETPTSWQLRMAFPREARALEDLAVGESLKSLGLLTKRVATRRQTSFRVLLIDNYELQISPVDRGADGLGEWFSWHAPARTRDNKEISTNEILESTIRAHIQLFYSDENGRSLIYSFTHHHQDIESLIRSSLHGIHQDLGLKLKPVLKRRK